MMTITMQSFIVIVAGTIRPLHLLSHRNFFSKNQLRVLGEQQTLSDQPARNVQTSTRVCKIFEVPSRDEGSLKQLYHNPKCLIHDLLEPLVNCGVTVTPQMTVTPKLKGRYWRARLHLQWPRKVTVSAVHTSVAGAKENAYLLACDLLKNMGLLYQPCSGSIVPMSADYILTVLQTLHSSSCHPFGPSPRHFDVVTRLAHVSKSLGFVAVHSSLMDGKRDRSKELWRTEVSASWPYSFDICSLGPSVHASQYAAALHTSMKLKALGLLSKENRLAMSRLPAICKRQRATVCREQFDPHYEIYSDASAFGFGAYLVKKDDDHIRWLASTWSEHFPDCPQINAHKRFKTGEVTSNSMLLESTFCELYSVVTACFTWKHKFVGKRVLVWTDNQATVRMVNCGLHGETKMKRLGKLYHILTATCQKYSIELYACHIQRTENTAADLLSRCQLAAFREVVPEAAPTQKKTKKLLFWNPLQTAHSNPQLHNKFL